MNHTDTLAGDGGNAMLFRFATRGESLIAPIEPLLGLPADNARTLGAFLLAAAQLFSDEGRVSIMPGGFDEDAAHMRIAGPGDRAARPPRATWCSDGIRPT